jgi:hypothetical protein
VKDGLGLADHVHFTREGYTRLADIIIDDLLAAAVRQGEMARQNQDSGDVASISDQADTDIDHQPAAAPSSTTVSQAAAGRRRLGHQGEEAAAHAVP